MKNYFFKSVLCSMTLLTISACVEEQLEQEFQSDAEVQAMIQVPASAVSYVDDLSSSVVTRTYIDEHDNYASGVGTMWRTKEVIGVYSAKTKNAKFTSVNTKSAGSVTFKGTVSGAAKYAYYPYSEANNAVPHCCKGNYTP